MRPASCNCSFVLRRRACFQENVTDFVNFNSFVVGGHFIIKISEESDSHFRCIVPSKNVVDKVCLYLHLDLFMKNISNTAQLQRGDTTDSSQVLGAFMLDHATILRVLQNAPFPVHPLEPRTRYSSTRVRSALAHHPAAQQNRPRDSPQTLMKIVYCHLTSW